MAVEIPVVVNIDKAFDEAAARLETASRPFREKLDSTMSSMKFNIHSGLDKAEYVEIEKILKTIHDYAGGEDFGFDHLVNALQNAKDRLNDLYATANKRGGMTGQDRDRALNLSKAIHLFEAEIDLRTRAATLASEEARKQIEISKAIEKGNVAFALEAKTMAEISDKISALKGKLRNIDPASDDWRETAEEIKNATEQLNEYEDKLKKIISPDSVSAEGSVNRIREEMRKLQREWDAMGKDDKFDVNGRLTPNAQAMVDKFVRLTDESEKYGRSLSDLAKKGKPAVDDTSKSLERQSSIFDGLIAKAARYFSIYSILRYAKQVRDVTGELEYQQVALGHLIQDEEYSATLFEKIKAAAKESPFRISELTRDTKQLAAYRIEQEQLFDTMTKLADVSAGLGVEMNRLILAYGQVRSASVLRGQELRQFTEAGIPLVQLLADKFTELNGKTVKTAEVFELISKRAVPFSMISDIFEDLTDKGGMFYEMQKRQADTLKGKWEKLKDAFDIGLQSVGQTDSFVKSNDAVLKVLNSLANNLVVVPKIINGVTASYVSYITVMKALELWAKRQIIWEGVLRTLQTARAVLTGQLSLKQLALSIQTSLLAKAEAKLAAATTAASKAFWKFNISLISNPVIALGAAIIGIVTAMLTFKQKTEETANSFKELDDMIEKTSKGLSEHDKLEKLISRYEALAQKTDKTVKEQNRLYDTMIRLQDEFPGMELGIDNETKSIEEQVEALRQENDERERELRLKAEGTLDSERIKLENAEKERNKLYKERLKLTQKTQNLERELAHNELYKDSADWKKAKLRIGEINQELVEQDENIGKLQKRIQRLYYILNPESAESPFNAWQRKIQSMRDISVDGITSQIFSDDEIEQWGTLDQALDAINKRKKEVRDREDELSDSIRKQTGEIREQIKAELDWARAERMRLEAMEDFFRTKSVFAQSISDSFSEALVSTFDKGKIEEWGKAALGYLTMQTNISFNPDLLLARPMVNAAKLVEKGWEDAGTGIATVFSSIYDWESETGKMHNLMVTPILPDGSVLSPDELDEYVEKVLLATNFKSDPKQLLLGIDVTPDAGERLHEMQEQYYSMVQMSEDLPEDFLISESDLMGLKEATDVIELIDKKIKALEEEIDRVNSINLDGMSEKEIEKTDNYIANLNAAYDVLKKIRDVYKLPSETNFSALAKEIKENFENAISAEFGASGGSGVVIPIDFLISEKDLLGLNNMADLSDLIEQKIEGVRGEIEKISKQNLDGVITDEAIEQAELYKINLEGALSALLQIRGQYIHTFSGLATEVQNLFPSLMESSYAGLDKEKYATTGLFSEEELRRLNNVVDLYSLWASKTNAVTKELEHYNGQLAETVDLERKQAILDIIAQLGKDKEALEELGKTYGFLLKETTPHGGGSQQDPWILIFKDRLKFVQDFAKGVQDLNQYMSMNNAIAKEREIMEGRGKSLGFIGNGELDVMAMTGAREEVMKWYDDTIKKIQDKISSLGGKTWAGLGVQAILAKDTKSRTIKAWQELLAEVFKQKTDFDLSQTKKDLEDAMKRMEEELKRSETARNFFNNILDITGDKDLAATMSVSVYGDIGREFKERMQSQLDKAFQSLDWTEMPDDLWGQLAVAFSSQDFNTILEHLELFPEEWQKMLLKMADDSEKHSADLMKNFADLVAKYGSTAQKIATIEAKAENEVKQVEDALAKSLTDLSLTPEQKKALQDRATEIIKAINAEKDLDVFKQSDEYIKFFSEINVMTAEQAATVRGELRKAYLKAFQEGAISADELRKNLRAIDEQFRKLSESTTLFGAYLSGGIDAANKKLQEYADNVTVLAAKMKSGKGLDSQEQNFASKMLQMFGSGSTEGIKSYEQLIEAFSNSGGMEAAGEAFGKMGEGMSAMAANGPGALAIVDAIIKAVNSTIVGIQQIIDQLNEVRGEDKKIGKWFRFLGDFNKYAFSGWEKLKSGDAIGAFVDTISSIISIFNNIQRVKVDKLNKKIEEQEKLIEGLEDAYNRLGKEIEKSFGSEYIYSYNKQVEMLKAKADAYAEQAKLEREKGKSADEKVALDYEKSARDVQDQIDDMRSQLAEFFSGTDLASAAEDFANSWIDAYKEFGSTADAMSDKFNEMIQNMINRSLAAKIMQEMLGPVFEQIDSLASDGLLSTEEIASIAQLAQERIPMINDAMTNLMTSLASAGLDVRTSTAGFKGISRNIAGASEESILGLAAGINTQNFYMSYMPTISENVSQILAAMTGTFSPTAQVETTENGDVMPSVQRLVYNYLPTIDQRLMNIENLFKSVVTPKSGTSTNTNCVAVR